MRSVVSLFARVARRARAEASNSCEAARMVVEELGRRGINARAIEVVNGHRAVLAFHDGMAYLVDPVPEEAGGPPGPLVVLLGRRRWGFEFFYAAG